MPRPYGEGWGYLSAKRCALSHHGVVCLDSRKDCHVAPTGFLAMTEIRVLDLYRALDTVDTRGYNDNELQTEHA